MSCRKEKLKSNPVMSNNELNEVSEGLGDEAAKESAEGKIAKGIGNAFD